MTEWVLIIILNYNGVAMSTIKLPDKDSCYRVGTRFATRDSREFTCTEVRKDSK